MLVYVCMYEDARSSHSRSPLDAVTKLNQTHTTNTRMSKDAAEHMTNVFEMLYDIKALCAQAISSQAAAAGADTRAQRADAHAASQEQNDAVSGGKFEKELEPLIEKAGGMMAKAMVRSMPT